MAVVQTYNIHHGVIIMWPTSWYTYWYAIYKSSPVASWDSEVSIKCTLKNLTEEVGHLVIFLPTICLWSSY